MFGGTTIFYVEIWNHPTETTIKRWLFTVPGSSESMWVAEFFALPLVPVNFLPTQVGPQWPPILFRRKCPVAQSCEIWGWPPQRKGKNAEKGSWDNFGRWSRDGWLVNAIVRFRRGDRTIACWMQWYTWYELLEILQSAWYQRFY